MKLLLTFTIYVFVLSLGLILIIISVLCFLHIKELYWDEVLLGFGCSTVPSALTAYFIDLANEKNKQELRIKLRKSFLFGFPMGVIWLSKTVIENFYCKEKSCSFKAAFDEAIKNMKSIKPNELDFQEYGKLRNQLLENLNYGLSLCNKDSELFIKERVYLEANDIFSEDELLSIKSFNDCCNRIKTISRIDELAEYLEVWINQMIKRIPEIKQKYERITEFYENGMIKNWEYISE